MQAYLSGQDISLSIPLLDVAGDVIAASAVEYRVIDQDETVLVAKTALSSFNIGDAEAQVSIAGALNDVGTATRALRVVELFITTATGTVQLSHEYVVEALSVLLVGVNSFQTYPQATLLGFELPNLPAWNDASKTERMNALMSAYRNFGRVALRYTVEDSEAQSRLITPPMFNSNDVTKLNAAQIAAMDASYRAALCRAQVLEADYLLGGDEVGEIRRAGVMSATTGESSNFFRPAKPYEGPLCKRALKELSSYLNRTMRIGRSS